MEKAEYKRLQSATIVRGFAIVVLVLGIVCIVAQFTGNSQGNPFIYGCACLISAPFLFVVSNIAEDIHYQAYLQEYHVNESMKYHLQSIQKLQTIEATLLQQYQPQPVPYEPAPYPVPQYDQPLNVFQSERPMPEPPVQKRTQQPEINTTSKVYEPQEETEADYKAQFMRPTPQKKRTTPSKKE